MIGHLNSADRGEIATPLFSRAARILVLATGGLGFFVSGGSAQPFLSGPVAPYTAELYATSPGMMGGVAFDSTGNPLVTPCAFSGGGIRRFDSQNTVSSGQNGQLVHPELSPFVSNTGCGITRHSDGTLYSNTNLGITNLSDVDGHVIRTIGSPGNALGITVDPYCSGAACTHRVVYVAANCRFTSTCDIRTVDPANPADDTILVSLNATQASFVDGIAFSIRGFLLLAVRSPQFGIGVVSINSLGQGARGQWDRLIPLTHEPDGIAFTPNPTPFPNTPLDWQGFAITNNTDQTMSRVQLQSSASPDIVTTIATGGFRGDLAQVGTDGYLYITQDGARFDNGVTANTNSLVRIGPGGFFSVPVGTAKLTLTPLNGANIVGSTHTVTAAITGPGSGAALSRQSSAAANLSGVTVFFKVVSGPNVGLTGSAVTDINGVARFSYLGSNLGTDYVQASFVTLSGGISFSNMVQQPWSATVCDVNSDGKIDSDDISQVLLVRNLSVSAGDARDADRNGIINVTDGRLCALKCTKPNCAK